MIVAGLSGSHTDLGIPGGGLASWGPVPLGFDLLPSMVVQGQEGHGEMGGCSYSGLALEHWSSGGGL